MNSDGMTLTHEELVAAYHQREQLLEHLAEKDQYLAEKDQRIAEKDQRISALEQQVEKYQRMLFGSKRERFDVIDGQLLMPFLTDNSLVKAAVEEELQTITYQRKRAEKKHPGRLPLPDHLPIVEIIHQPDEDVSSMRSIGQEITDELGYEPERFFIRRHIREKYISAEDDHLHQHVVIAQLPERPIDKCEASVELLTQMTIDKHIYHLPIYRQLQRFTALGVPIPSSTADNWQRLLGLLLRPLYAVLVTVIETASYLQADETTLKVQDRTKKGTTHSGVMWVYHALLERAVVFDYQRGHGRVNCQKVLSKPRRYLQSDGNPVYNVHKARADLIALGCWAHVRRKFFDAQSDDPARAKVALALIGKLYDVERDARQRTLAPELRKELRLEKSLPVLNVIGSWLAAEVEHTLPKSPIGKAFRYAIKLWDELQNYLLDGNLEIDNNLVENAIRPLALGRKNYLFAGSDDGAVNIAMYRSFFGTCRLNDIDPHAWLLYVLKNIRSTPTEDYHKLLPQNIDPALLA
jgi:transposase